ncbi:hypothetical protein NQ176_g1447 [Zarea fungicola]|uniref:Uncharacterized protein n=1 Tax=Zarea fungicola TaxID=93591 RepID=A0ACC1NTT3_9HYPO|nr:hypothetical protein NQ176_g1447 [Lecanicillium fungicola]
MLELLNSKSPYKQALSYHPQQPPNPDTVLMNQPSKTSVAVRLGALFFVLLDVALVVVNCFNAHSATSLASTDMRRGYKDHGLLATQVQRFEGLRVPETAISTAIICSVHAIVGVLFICYSRVDVLWIVYFAVQFVLTIMLLSMGGTIAVRIPAYRLLFETYYGQNSNLYYHVMYYGSIAEAVYGGLEPMATIGMVPGLMNGYFEASERLAMLG